MTMRDWNELPVEELERLHEEEDYQYTICDGRIMWVHEG